jgi:protein-S-isoprenylcysteine O-methyltransferase Ste14
MNPASTTLPDKSGVPVAPPILYLAALLAAIGLDALWPIAPMPPALSSGGGWALVTIGAVLGVACVVRFRRAGTGIPTYRPTTTLVTDGLYRYSRNPIYVGLAAFYLGLALLAGSWWGFILLPVIVGVVHYIVIAREEAYLERKFGDAYRAYKARVRRWF